MPCKGDYNTRTCVVCGKSFRCPPSADTVCCCADCSHVHRQALHEAGVYQDAVGKMITAKDADPRLMRGPEHINAKEWVICSPSGQIFRCRNLLNWCREHADLLDGTPHQAWDGITKIKYSMQGKRPHCKSKSWKGWTLLDWS